MPRRVVDFLALGDLRVPLTVPFPVAILGPCFGALDLSFFPMALLNA